MSGIADKMGLGRLASLASVSTGWIVNMRVRTKLLGAFGLVSLLTVVVAFTGLRGVTAIDKELVSLYEDGLQPIRRIINANQNVVYFDRDVRSHVLATDPAEMSRLTEQIAKDERDFKALLDEYRKTSQAQAQKEKLTQLDQAWAAFRPSATEVLALSTQGKKADAQAALAGAYQQVLGFIDTSLTDLSRASEDLADKNMAEAKGTTASSSRAVWIASTLAMVFGIGLALFMASGFTSALSLVVARARQVADKDLAGLTEDFQALARGDLTRRFTVSTELMRTARRDEFGDLAATFDGMLTRLHGAAGAFEEMAGTLQSMAEETKALVTSAVEGRLSTRGQADRFEGGYREIVEGVNQTLDAVIGPLNMAATYIDRISKGEIPPKITESYSGDFNEIKNNLNRCIDAVDALVADAAVLSAAAVDGRLATRADAAKHGGDFRKIVQGVNDTLDAVIGPLNVAAEYVDRISKGDIPPKITDRYNGDFNEIKINLNTCIDAVHALIADADLLSRAAVEGKLATRADVTRHQGDFRAIVKGVNDTLDSVIGPLNVAAEYVDRIGKGDIPPKITDRYNGDFNEIKNNLNQCIDAVNALVADARLLSNGAVEGKLSTRADASKHGGDFRTIVEGVNATLDSVIGPLNVAAEYVDRISKGDIPPKITDRYNGDFNEIKNNLNQCIDAVNALVADADMLSRAAVEGKLATRADATRHHGDFRKIVTGVNDTLDSVIGPLNVAAEYVDRISKGDIPPKITDRYNGDFNEIKNNLNQCIGSIQALVADFNLLVEAAVGGRLQTRADANRHHGDYRKIVEGVNRTLEAVIKPVNEAAGVLARVAQQDLRAQVEGDYAGDHAAIKTSINTMIVDLRGAIGAIGENAQHVGAAAEELTAISQQMSANSDQTATETAVVSAASEQVSQNLTVVATAAEEMLSSIREIAKNANDAANTAQQAVSVAHATDETVRRLGDSSQEIGNVVKVITSIAEQTNLLALNATIEAARAGDAGKGFAVVANEVKELAKATARATEEISKKIEAVQGDTKGAVEAIRQIASLITRIDEVSSTIASAVEEQSATTNEIGRNISEAARGSAEIARNVASVAGAAQSAAQGAGDTQSASRQLAGMATQLQGLVGRFRT